MAAEVGRDLNDSLPARVGQAAAQFEEHLVTAYAEATPLRALVATLPVIGSPLDAFLGTRGQNISNRRLLATIEALRDAFNQLDAEKVDETFLESEEFYDLTWKVFERGRRTRGQERLEVLARILRGSVENKDFRPDAEAYLDLVDALSDEEFQLAAEVFQCVGVSDFDWRRLNWLAKKPAAERFLEIAPQLEAKGVIRRSVQVKADDFARVLNDMLQNYHPHDIRPCEEFSFTERFRKLLSHLRGDDPHQSESLDDEWLTVPLPTSRRATTPEPEYTPRQTEDEVGRTGEPPRDSSAT